MQDQKVTITDSRIYYTDRPTSIVMDEVSKDLMKVYSDIVCQNGGQILDIGFGLGYSANFIYENVGNYSCIEINPQIYQKALEWAKDKDNVFIYLGNWTDIIPQLADNNIKYDGIFMDTFGDTNYGKFEKAAQLIANQNCCLSIYEYAHLKDKNLLNNKIHKLDNSKYSKVVKNYKDVSWAYYVGNKFQKKELFRKYNSLIPVSLCKEIIESNKHKLTPHKASANVKGIVHERSFNLVEKLKVTDEFASIIKSTILKEYDATNINDLDIDLYEYIEGNKYDRHVMTKKGLPLNNPDQLCLSIDISLNDNYTGGDLEVYDSWERNDKNTFAELSLNTGDVVTYRPYQHVTFKPIVSGSRYQMVIQIRNKDLKKSKKFWI